MLPTLLTTTILTNKNGDLLLVKRANNPFFGLWSLPGGKVNTDELLSESSIREIEEELGIKMKEVTPIGFIELDKPNHAIVFIYSSIFIFDEDKLDPATREISDIKWVSIDKIDSYEPFPPNHRKVIDFYLNKIQARKC
ncbi:TPA: hypothetical protein DEW47_01125 [Patescibacteria group bacterium]|nr:MAG: Mutator MutT protein [Parcubacteria group bacterium GW2011_GWF2_40_10]KKR47329.1 MAG: Mutator MutT protein [Parcubacteria group bacterium GW2011_GWA2_40_143]KKR59971.1 MAG: Mutator MutT protein [Parcubacteria group bacterium GW2011_GWC2_40_31]KKR74615.1 MAG: Mutator MutT protein [Parcubacteria group bacterium GW2011_GWB2_40_8]KKR76389.1 MAG: Mutator MutT protein [Parcubacteria group bacterium GW2011_GWE2_40_8]KKR83072.1 MAG: Mutator MutT protein [Parcubacteria group bacterium GW2011_GW